jgi:hypothetical protein
MPRLIRAGLIQASSTHPGTAPLPTIERAMIEKHIRLLAEVRNVWQFYRDHRPETYGPIVAP